MNKPFVVVVTGRPGSGKTTLAHTLAKRIHCPALCRDEFKEGYVHTLGGTHASLGPDVNRRLYDIFFETVEFVASKGVSLVIEAAFQHALWAPKLGPLADIARVALVVCAVPADLARARYVERVAGDPARDRFHGDSAALATSDSAGAAGLAYDPPRLNVPTLVVDTTDGYSPSMDAVVAFLERTLRPAQGS